MEEWRDIIGFDGLYQVSNFGRVKSLNYNGTGKEKVMSGSLNRDGYIKVTLTKDKKKYSRTVHRLVAEAFIPNLENKPQVGHLKTLPDGTEDKTANEAWNLAWMTPLENNIFGTRTERLSKTKTNGKKSKKVYQYTLDGLLIAIWPSVNECGRNGYTVADIANCCKKKPHYKTYKGYKWSYEPL